MGNHIDVQSLIFGFISFTKHFILNYFLKEDELKTYVIIQSKFSKVSELEYKKLFCNIQNYLQVVQRG